MRILSPIVLLPAALMQVLDAEGEVLDVLVQSKRNKHAALN